MHELELASVGVVLQTSAYDMMDHSLLSLHMIGPIPG